MQALLIYELGNKIHLKNINDQNFVHFVRGVTTKAFTVISFYIEIKFKNSLKEVNQA